MKRKAIEIGKDAVIVLLLCSIVLLTRSLLPTSITGEAAGKIEVPAGEAQFVTAAKPLCISARSEAGRATVQGDADALDGAWEQWGGLLGQAMSTAQSAETVGEAAFYGAMKQPGVYFGFAGEIPAQALARWLGSDRADLTGASGDWLLTADRDGTSLWMYGTPCLRCRTELPREALTAALANVMPDGSRFCLELEDVETDAHPLTLWPDGAVTALSATWEDPCDSAWANKLASSLAFNPYGSGTYTDPQGNIVFTEASRTCTVGADGTVTLQSADAEAPVGTAADETAAARIEAARALLEAICGDSLGDARLYLTACEGDVCRFGYALGGCAVTPDAAAVTFEGDRIVSAEALVRTLRLGTTRQTLMPVNAAAAIVAPGSRLSVGYALAGGGAVNVGWTAR